MASSRVIDKGDGGRPGSEDASACAHPPVVATSRKIAAIPTLPAKITSKLNEVALVLPLGITAHHVSGISRLERGLNKGDLNQRSLKAGLTCGSITYGMGTTSMMP